MKRYPEVPRAADAPPDLFESGHLWLQERIDGAHLRFRLRESGLLEFGDRTRTFGDTDDMPASYRHAVRRVRESFDREALRAARDDPASVVFFGEATVRRRVDYDWDRVPAVLGFDVWDADADRFLPPDAVEQVFDRVGLDPVNAVAKEVRAADFDPADYDVPDSAWYHGPAAGVVVRNKTGGRAVIPNSDVAGADETDSDAGEAAPVDRDASPTDLAERFVTPERVERVAADLEGRGQRVTFDAVFERAFEAVAREEHHLLFGESASVDVGAFRSAVAARVQELLDE